MDWLDVLKCIEAGESRTVEFKAGFDTSKIGPAACAFANTDGGVVILGVNDSGEIVGIPKDPEWIRERLTQFLGSGFNYPMTAFYGRHEDPQGWVHWIQVPRKIPSPCSTRMSRGSAGSAAAFVHPRANCRG